MEHTFSVPISLETGIKKKKRYYLNLNGYRNWDFRVNNQLKKLFKITIAKDIKHLEPLSKKCKVTYTIYYPNRRAFDIDNIGSVVCKFTMDALTEYGIIEDDNCNFVTNIEFVFGGVDKEHPRCDVKLEEIK